MADHVHMLFSVPPKLAVSSVVGYMKGKSAIHVARHLLRRERNYAGQSLWARGYFVDTTGGIRRRSDATSKSKTPKTGDSTNSSRPARPTSNRSNH